MNHLLKFHNSREYADSMKPLNDQRFANTRFKTGPDWILHLSYISCMELSHDETFFITGGSHDYKNNVLKLTIRDVYGTTKTELNTTVIHSAQYSTDEEGFNSILCLAISPDDHRIFSGGSSRRVLIHDIQR